MTFSFSVNDACVGAVAKYIAAVRRSYADFRDYMDSVKRRDPAAVSIPQILLLYSGVHAVAAHRVAHALYEKGCVFAARAVSQIARHLTGIEIHPAARIGKGLFIDHGMGVVIGETTEIGDYCTLYQGVTLGGTGKDTGKRHPTLGNNVMVGAGAKVLGPFTVGDGAKIASGAVVLCEVPAGTTAVGIPAKPVDKSRESSGSLDQIHIPDPISQMIRELSAHTERLEREIGEMKSRCAECGTSARKAVGRDETDEG